MIVIQSYLIAVLMCVITMLCWGSWANTQKLASKKWAFQLFYWDYSLGVLILSLILAFLLTTTVSFAQEERSKVGIRPYPRDKAHEMTGGGRVAFWKPGIGNYDDVLKADDYTALNVDVVKGYNGVFCSKKRFFEHYIHTQGGDWVDPNPKTNKLIKTIRNYEEKGNEVLCSY